VELEVGATGDINHGDVAGQGAEGKRSRVRPFLLGDPALVVGLPFRGRDGEEWGCLGAAGGAGAGDRVGEAPASPPVMPIARRDVDGVRAKAAAGRITSG
jgi:hypothetical protein